MSRTRFIKHPNGTRVKQITLNDGTKLKIIIPENEWSLQCSRSVTYWIKQAIKGNIRPFHFGKIIHIIDSKEEGNEAGNELGNLRDNKEAIETSKKNDYSSEPKKADTDTVNVTILESIQHKLDVDDDISSNETEEVIFTSSHEHSMEYSRIYTCDKCKKIFKTTGGLSKHRRKCTTLDEVITYSSSHPSPTHLENIREHGPVITVTDNQNVTVNIQNNITLREFGKENPRWLTSSFLYNVIQDIPRAIPRLLERKHFNDDFPENKNLRIDTRRSIDKRLQVFETGRWKIKDSKQTFYRVLLEIYDILCDALENDLEDSLPDPDDNRTPEEQSHISNEIKKLRNNERFIQKLERIRPVWDDFREKINDHDHRNELWEDLKTLLLDRHLAIEQGFE
jgi:hypothetical protein